MTETGHAKRFSVDLDLKRSHVAELAAWKTERLEHTANFREPFVACRKESRLLRADSCATRFGAGFKRCAEFRGRERLATLAIDFVGP